METTDVFTLGSVPDDVLLALTSLNNFAQGRCAQEVMRDTLREALKESQVSTLLGGRILLGDRYPTFGKEGKFYTKEPVGYSWKKSGKVCIPSFGIVAKPSCPPRYAWDIPEMRQVFQESVAAIDRCEIEYFHALMDSASQYNPHYPRIRVSVGELTASFFQWVGASMHGLDVTPRAIFANDSLRGGLTPIADELKLALITAPDWNAVDIFGMPNDPRYTTALLVDDGFSFKVHYDGVQGRVDFTLKEEVGFSVGPAGSIRITLDGQPKPPDVVKEPRIKGFAVGEEGGDIISLL